MIGPGIGDLQADAGRIEVVACVARGGAFQLHRLRFAESAPPFAEDGITMRVRFSGQQRQEAAAEVVVARVDAGEIVDRGGEVDEFHEGVADARGDGNAAGRLDEQRHAGQAILHRVLRLFDETVVAREVAMVREEEDGGFVVEGPVLERLHELAELVVEAGAHAVVDGAQLRPLLLGPALQPLVVADALEHGRLAVPVRRVLCPARQLVPVDQAVPRLLDAVGRVGVGEGKVDAEGLVAVVAVDEINGAEDMGPVAVAIPGLARVLLQPAF